MIPSFALALSFLTIFRLPGLATRTASPSELAASFVFFPVVGAWLGVIWVLLTMALRPCLPSGVLAVLLTAVLAVLTRGLHLDGLADLADGVGGGYTPERRLEIMKDSRIGTFGGVALILILAMKIGALNALLQAGKWQPLLLVPMLSRLGMVLGAYRSVYPRPEGGLGKSFCEQLRVQHTLAAGLLALIGSLAISPVLAGFMLVSLMVCVGLVRVCSRTWLGGITGDVLGALNEISEAVLLAVAAALVPHLS